MSLAMENPLSKLALDYWYQVLMVVCVLVFLLTGAGILKEVPVAPVQQFPQADSSSGSGNGSITQCRQP